MDPEKIQTKEQAVFVLAVLDHLAEGGRSVSRVFREINGLVEPSVAPEAEPVDPKYLLGQIYYFYNVPNEEGEILSSSGFSRMKDGYSLEPNGYFTTDNPEVVALADAGKDVINPLLDKIAFMLCITDYKLSGEVIDFPGPGS